MNQAIRYYSSQQNHLQYNYPMQPYSLPSNSNANRFQQEIQVPSIQNDYNVNQDNQFVAQQITNIQWNNDIEEIDRGFTNNDISQNENRNQNQQKNLQYECKEQQFRETYLFAVLELVFSIILTIICYENQDFQYYFIDDSFQVSKLSFSCCFISIIILVLFFKIQTRENYNPNKCLDMVGIVTWTLFFQNYIVCSNVVVFKTLNLGCKIFSYIIQQVIYIQFTQGYIVLILLIFIIWPQYCLNLIKYFCIVIVLTFSFVLFMSIYFEDHQFWWLFGVPVIAYLLSINILMQFVVIIQIFKYIQQNTFEDNITSSIMIHFILSIIMPQFIYLIVYQQ